MRMTGYKPIQSEQAWKDSGLLLGEAVHAVVKHMQLNPPEIIDITDKGLQSLNKHRKFSNGNKKSGSKSPTRSGNGSRRNRSASNNSTDAPPGYHVVAESATSKPAPDVPMPSIPSSFPEVKDLDRADLDELMEGGDDAAKDQ